MRMIEDERIARYLVADDREAKQAVWLQDTIKGLRQLVRDLADQAAVLRQEKPLHTSDVWLEVGTADERYVGLGHRASIRVPIGDDRWPNGEPRRYVDVRAGRPQRIRRAGAVADFTPAPVEYVEVRTSGTCMVLPDFSNGIRVVTDLR